MPFLDAMIYRKREHQWREHAAEIPAGADRDASLELAEGYARLVELIERANAQVAAQLSVQRPIDPDQASR